MRLQHRIRSQPAVSRAAVDGTTVSGGAASPGGAPSVMPAFKIEAYPTDSSNTYTVLGYVQMMPAWTAGGGAVTFTQPPGQVPHAKLCKAGRP